MARNRVIKKEFWTDEKLGKMSLLTRHTFIGIWNLSDDLGICRASSSYIRNQLYGFDESISMADIDKCLGELEKEGIIVFATYSKERYLKVKNFHRHQVINRPSQSFVIAGLLKEQIDELFLKAESGFDKDAKGEIKSAEEVVKDELNKIANSCSGEFKTEQNDEGEATGEIEEVDNSLKNTKTNKCFNQKSSKSSKAKPSFVLDST